MNGKVNEYSVSSLFQIWVQNDSICDQFSCIVYFRCTNSNANRTWRPWFQAIIPNVSIVLHTLPNIYYCETTRFVVNVEAIDGTKLNSRLLEYTVYSTISLCIQPNGLKQWTFWRKQLQREYMKFVKTHNKTVNNICYPQSTSSFIYIIVKQPSRIPTATCWMQVHLSTYFFWHLLYWDRSCLVRHGLSSFMIFSDNHIFQKMLSWKIYRE